MKMFTKRLYIAFHTEDAALVEESKQFLHELYNQVQVDFYPCEDDMIDAAYRETHEIKAIILDLDTCRDDMEKILRRLRVEALRNVIVAGFNRKDDPELMEKFFMHQGNIYFELPTKSGRLQKKLRHILKVLFRTYTTGLNLDYLIVKL